MVGCRTRWTAAAQASAGPRDRGSKLHECTMDSLSDKVGKYFFEALDEVASKELGKCRLEWNLKVRENDKRASRFPTIFDTNRVFDEYVKMHVKIDPVSEHSVLFDVCYQES